MDKTMNLREIIASLRDQAMDKESLNNGENGIFARDMEALMIAAEALERLEAAMEILAWVPGGEKEKYSTEKRIRLMDAFAMLSAREKKVLIMLDGLDGTPQSMDTVGREFGVTRERIRQLADRAHAKLAHAISDRSVADLLRECAREIMEGEKHAYH
jgi:RNA polymerase sigma factor (sigma-70 family)